MLIDHPSERSANLRQHTPNQHARGCCKAIPGDNFEAVHLNHMGTFYDLLGNFFALKAS